MQPDDEDLLREVAQRHAEDSAWDGPPELRAAVFARTRGHLRFRRGRRYALAAAVIAAVYGAGVLTPYMTSSRTGAHLAQAPPAAEAAEAAEVPHEDAALLEVERFALELAKAGAARKAELLRNAGDDALERGALEAALRYYRLYLNHEEPAARRRVAASDTWLLIALRAAETKETNDVVHATY
jgi:hypothetical protein